MEQCNKESNLTPVSIGERATLETKFKSIDEIVDEGIEIYNKFRGICKKEKIGVTDEKKLSELLSHFISEYREFYASYPIVMKFMIELGQFSYKAFKRYLLWQKEHPYKSHKEFNEGMAKYLGLLYKAKNPHYKEKDAQAYEKNARDSLNEELDNFEKEYEKAKKETDRTKKMLADEKRSELIAVLQRNLDTE
jgi:hypothetical protein